MGENLRQGSPDVAKTSKQGQFLVLKPIALQARGWDGCQVTLKWRQSIHRIGLAFLLGLEAIAH
ncbi:MAG: hypothetical protein HQL68_00715 [Magnetococcales bacterium]|nr:hypothetical protein [Magnetococcales bacterium]